MTRRRSERRRWVVVYRLYRGVEDQTGASFVKRHDEARAVVAAFEAVGRVVRVEIHMQTLVFKARRA